MDIQLKKITCATAGYARPKRLSESCVRMSWLSSLSHRYPVCFLFPQSRFWTIGDAMAPHVAYASRCKTRIAFSFTWEER